MKKSLFNQIMRPIDWVKLVLLIIAFLLCWFWVLKAYSQPFDYDRVVGQVLSGER